MNKLEYLEQRCLIHEGVIHNLISVIQAHLPAAAMTLSGVVDARNRALDVLDPQVEEQR